MACDIVIDCKFRYLKMSGEHKMEMLILGIFLAPFVLAIVYITGNILLRTLAVLWVDAFSLMGWDAPKKYVERHF